MKLYITGHFHTSDDKPALERLSRAIRAAHMKDFSFVRDVEEYRPLFTDAKARWDRIYDELRACDGLLVDVISKPSASTIIECGMAYALRKPVIVAVKQGADYTGLVDGIAVTVIYYSHDKDITAQLKKYDHTRSFTIIDHGMLFAVLAVTGAVSAWWLTQLFVPLGAVWLVAYWLLVRQLVPSVRVFDRSIIFVSLAVVWLGGAAWLLPVSMIAAWAWLLGFWLVVLVVLQRTKLSL